MKSSLRARVLAGVASTLVPGLGQFLTGRRARGLGLCALTALMLGLIGWAVTPQAAALTQIPMKGQASALAWLIVVGIVWAWNIWDAATPAGARAAWLPALAVLTMFFTIGWQTTQVNLQDLTQNFNRLLLIARPMLRPDFVQPRAETLETWVVLSVPCPPNPPAGVNTVDGRTLKLSAGCAKVGDILTLSSTGLWPNVPAQLIWQSTIGDFLPLRTPEQPDGVAVPVDASGAAMAQFQVPNVVPPGVDPSVPEEQRLYVRQERPLGGYELSTNGYFVLLGIYQTITLALMATTLGTLLAIPISFLAARNLMSANALTLAIYVAIRTLLNIVRSVESLIIAIVFVVIVGLGPFAGMLALAVHTVAALAKLYSEVIEGIDPGPIEAMRTTGANWLQVVRYGVVPQIVPPFTAFTIYRWDINVRASTIIGFVGGGGIGFFLVQWINLGDYRAVSAAFVSILVVVMLMDIFSARVRARLN
jgi:phosphonate transport system permease protein